MWSWQMRPGPRGLRGHFRLEAVPNQPPGPFEFSPLLGSLLDDVRAGRLSPAEAEPRVRAALLQEASENLGFARVDHERGARQGFPEVVFGQGKTPDQVAAIADAIVRRGHSLLVTRTDAPAFDAVVARVPDAVFHERARIIERRTAAPRGQGTVLVAAAGTSDIPVADEAARRALESCLAKLAGLYTRRDTAWRHALEGNRQRGHPAGETLRCSEARRSAPSSVGEARCPLSW